MSMYRWPMAAADWALTAADQGHRYTSLEPSSSRER
jgi:hypothetical protein